MELFKKDTLTHGLVGGVQGAAVGLGAAAAMASVPVFVPIAAAAAAGTVLGALHGAGDEGGKCRKVVKEVAKVATIGINLAAAGVKTGVLDTAKKFFGNAAS